MSKFFKRAAIALVSASAATVAAAATPKLDTEALQKFRGRQQAAMASIQGQKPGASGAVAPRTQASELFVNPYRSYPTSCLNSPLSYGLYVGNPEAVQAQITLFGDPFSSSSAERNYAETVTITVFRLPCADGLSASLLEIDRPANMDGHTDLYPTLPGVTVSQGAVNDFPIRFADDPNTFFATNYANSPLYVSDVYVLENLFNNQAPYFNYNQAFTLTINDFATSLNLTDFNMAAYQPSHYPAASQPLVISGHQSSNWSNPNQGGEGIVLQVYDVGNNKRVISFAWFTYDETGVPYWLYGDQDFTIGARTVAVPTLYFGGGSFVGNLPGGVPYHSWGTVSFSFPDCNNMNISYTGDAGSNGPTGSGSKTFVRVAYVNGVACI